MATATTTEIRPALTMTHRTSEECAQHPLTRLWIEWATRHGFAWSIDRRHYYNLPSGRPEGFGSDDPGRSERYWELHVQADLTVERPSYRACTSWGVTTLDEALAAHREIEAAREAGVQAALDDIAANKAAVEAAYRAERHFPLRTDWEYRCQALSRGLWKAARKGAEALSTSSISYEQAFEAASISD